MKLCYLNGMVQCMFINVTVLIQVFSMGIERKSFVGVICLLMDIIFEYYNIVFELKGENLLWLPSRD